MSEAKGSWFIVNGLSLELSQFHLYENLIAEVPSVYEVIRVEEGVPLFLEDYIQRLQNSYSILDRDLPLGVEEITSTIGELVRINKHVSGPVKLVFGAGEKEYFLAFLMKAHLPDDKEYESGVRTTIMQETRKNPNLKMWNMDLRERSISILKKRKAYEAILINPDGLITEASRSNVFFIQGDKVFTTPVDLVLPGITRKKVLEVCALHQIDVVFRKISISEIQDYDSCFLTGTARKIVPVRNIDDRIFDVDTKLMKDLSRYFEEHVSAYITMHR